MKNPITPLYPSSKKYLDKSAGCYQYDSEGKEYIDFESGVWCTNLGHSHEKIVDIISKQSRQSIHSGYRFRSQEAEELSIKLQKLIGINNGSSVFLSSGSEAVNLSISIAQKLTGRKKILKINNSYLSAYGYGQNNPGNENMVNVKFNDFESIKYIDFAEISAFIIEVGGASVDMVQFPDVAFIREISRLAHSQKCLVIADEVTTGLGRLGKWFGFQHYNIQPDMVVTGKALGNGYPISAVTVDTHVHKRISTDPFRYAQSHQNDPMGCAIGLEVIKIIEQENLIVHCEVMGRYFKEQLDNLKATFPEIVKEIRAKGLMLAIRFFNTFNGDMIGKDLFENGFVLGYKNNTLRLLPPLTITQKEIDKLLNKLDELLQTQ